MSRDPKLDEAANKLIETFAEQLRGLNDGKAIPLQWKNRLLKAIKPAQQKHAADKNVTRENALDAMQATADFLFALPYPSRHLLHVANAFREYLANNYETTDRALGLRLGRGQYVRPEDPKHAEMICKALCDILNGRPFRTAAELNGYSEKDFLRLFERYSVPVTVFCVAGSPLRLDDHS